jgi:hypothetical protein
MVNHIVFWKMKPTANGRTGQENAQEMKRLLKALSPLIPELRSLSVGLDFCRTEAAWDIALYTTFDNVEDLQVYQQHPEHQKVVSFVVSVVASRAVVDFES